MIKSSHSSISDEEIKKYYDVVWDTQNIKHMIIVNHSALQVQSLILRHECLMYVLT
ncbi:hypothetical protein [Candidatus Tisiphia endosymbiont of Parasteatoda lunata]|uniref:hypothetical protein n=1 Tax=Candidatus Tisiphia endosymbiont of Parasteatoda lunata TaxID=3066275 RepID=UPI00313E44D0